MERASAKLAAAFQIVFDTTSEQVDTDTGDISPPEVETLETMWARIEQVVPRHELAAANSRRAEADFASLRNVNQCLMVENSRLLHASPPHET